VSGQILSIFTLEYITLEYTPIFICQAMSELTKTLQKTLLWISMKKEKSLSLISLSSEQEKIEDDWNKVDSD